MQGWLMQRRSGCTEYGYLKMERVKGSLADAR
jgi:hypothetical protein